MGMVYSGEGDISATTQGVQPIEEARAVPHIVPDVHSRGAYEKVVKPAFDRITGIALSILTLPLVLLIVPGIWMSLGSQAVYKQRRIGRFGREFTVYKFRTMETDRRNGVVQISHDDRRKNHKSEDDPRHIPYGRFLRKWSLDEIPQLWNIALGSMSLVGPRPELPEIVARYEEWQHRRHEVKPGLTGLWQVMGRKDLPLHENLEYDFYYINNQTLFLDLLIMVETAFCTVEMIVRRLRNRPANRFNGRERPATEPGEHRQSDHILEIGQESKS